MYLAPPCLHLQAPGRYFIRSWPDHVCGWKYAYPTHPNTVITREIISTSAVKPPGLTEEPLVATIDGSDCRAAWSAKCSGILDVDSTCCGASHMCCSVNLFLSQLLVNQTCRFRSMPSEHRFRAGHQPHEIAEVIFHWLRHW